MPENTDHQTETTSDNQLLTSTIVSDKSHDVIVETNFKPIDESASDSKLQVETSPLEDNITATIPPEPSRLEKLRSFQRTIQDQLRMVNNRVFDLETIYLEDTLHGNLVKGWEMDGRVAPLYRSRSIIEDKERLFSFSSHRYQQERKLHPELYVPANDRLPRLSSSMGNGSQGQYQKQRKSMPGNYNSNANASTANSMLTSNANNKKRKTNDFLDDQQAFMSWNGLDDY